MDETRIIILPDTEHCTHKSHKRGRILPQPLTLGAINDGSAHSTVRLGQSVLITAVVKDD